MPEPGSASLWYVTYLPKGRENEPINVGEDILSLKVEDHEKKVDKLTITLDNHRLDKLDSEVWERGNVISVIFGHSDSLAPAREYIIRKITGGRILKIEGHGKAVLMDSKTKSRVFENVTRYDVVRQIAIENGYTDEYIDQTSHVFESISQHNLTDAQFLSKLAGKEGFQFFVDFTGLHWHERAMGQAPIRELIYHVDPGQGDIIDFDVENDISRKPGKITVKGRDPLERKDFSVVKNNQEDKDRDVLTEFVNIIDGETGRRLLVVEETVSTEATTEAEAVVEAKRRYRKVQQKSIRMKVIMRGDARIVAKSVILISGMGARYSGKYYVQSASHMLSGGAGFQTVLHIVTDGHNLRKEGKVSSLNQRLAQCPALLREALQQESVAASGLNELFDTLYPLIEEVENYITKIRSAPKASVSVLAQQAIDVLLSVRQYARRAGLGNFNLAVEDCLSQLRPLTLTSTDEESAGKVNNKDVVDQDVLTLRNIVDSETGRRLLELIDTAGREK